MRFLDLFSGIGGFRMGLESTGFECVGFVEIDKFARKSYEAIYDTQGEWTAHDIREVSTKQIKEIGQIDIICGGFPCQAFSVAGKRRGFQDTRGTLFFEIARIAKQIKPRLLLLENVKGLLSHAGGETFLTILSTLDELGYDAEWQILNSKNYGVPQSRERVFIIGHLRGSGTRKIFPLRENNSKNNVGSIVAPTLTARYAASQREGVYIESTRNEKSEVRAVLTPDREEKRQNGRRLKEPGEPMFTLTAQDRHGVLVTDNYVQWDSSGKGYHSQQDRAYFEDKVMGTLSASNNGGKHNVLSKNRIRRLTPKECWRLQGFPDWAFEKASKVNSDTQLYKQAGNSVTVNVISELANLLKKSI